MDDNLQYNEMIWLLIMSILKYVPNLFIRYVESIMIFANC